MIYMALMLQRLTDLQAIILYIRGLDTTQNTSRMKESASFTRFFLSWSGRFYLFFVGVDGYFGT